MSTPDMSVEPGVLRAHQTYVPASLMDFKLGVPCMLSVPGDWFQPLSVFVARLE